MIVCGLIYQFTASNSFANIGVDFKGGTMLTVEYSGTNGMNSGEKYNKNLSIIEEVLNEKGFSSSVAQTSGENSIIVKYINTAVVDGQAIDYNTDEKVEEMYNINESIRKSIESKVPAEFGETVKASCTTTVIGNSASIKLLRTALISIAVSLLIILIYIIIRFDFYSGLAAVIALTHDLVMMMAFTIIFHIEISSTIVAAIITIVGYSINNTIVILDKIRSNIKPFKTSGMRYDMGDIVNKSIFATMTRTLYTTLTTLVTIVLIAALGVASVRNFALPIMFGLIAGFYSSVFLASPLWGGLKNMGENMKRSNANKKFKKGDRAQSTKLKKA
jgi:preprotein translocase subunit SecF